MALQIKTFSTADQWLEEASDIILSSFREAGSNDRKFLMGLSGGKTPVSLYQALSSQEDFLNGSHFFLVDERNVPWTEERSNHKLIVDHLFAGRSEGKQLWDFQTELAQPACLKAYAETINYLAPAGLDLAIIGVGADGHFASIFPGFTDWSDESITLASITEINEVRERYSLSPSYLLKSKKILVLLAGKSKAELLVKFQDEAVSIDQFPAKILMKNSALKIIYLEEDLL